MLSYSKIVRFEKSRIKYILIEEYRMKKFFRNILLIKLFLSQQFCLISYITLIF